jgi:hypothetical protein
MIVLFPHERIIYPNAVREDVRAHQPECGIPPAPQDIPAAMPVGTGPVDGRPVPLLRPSQVPAPTAEVSGSGEDPGFPSAAP